MWFQSTHPVSAGGPGSPCFNPRTPRGYQQQPEQSVSIHAPRGQRGLRRVSIHAPRAGCDKSTTVCSIRTGCFNPRTRAGCDVQGYGRGHRRDQFQSTHPRGVRHSGHSAVSGDVPVSIHAPARGATPVQGHQSIRRRVSIHAPRFQQGGQRRHVVSIHAPRPAT